MQCEAGLLSVTGTPEAPSKAGISVADIAAGMYAYTGVLTALYERERTGRGSGFAVSLLDALGEWMSQPYLYTVYGGREPRRTGARHASISPYGPYQARGGEVFNGLRYIVKTGMQWRWMPHDLPPWPVVYQQTQRWFAAGSFAAIVHDLRVLLRRAEGRAPQPSAAIFDSQTLQSTTG